MALLAILPLLAGATLTYLSRSNGGIWLEIGTGLVGGSVIGLVFALVQHTLDNNAAERQAAEGIRFTVSSTRDLSGIDLDGKDLTRTYMRGKVLVAARLDGAVLDGVDLAGSNLDQASLLGASLRGANLTGVSLAAANLHHASLNGAVFAPAVLRDACLVDADLSGADLSNLVFEAADEHPERTTGLLLSRARLERADISKAHLAGAMASFVKAKGLNASGAILNGADLSCSDLRRACLSGATLVRADLSGADLRDAILVDTDLTECRLVGARLRGADLQGAKISDADFAGAELDGAHVGRLNLAEARNVAAASSDVDHRSDASEDDSGMVLTRVVLRDATRNELRTKRVIELLRKRRNRLDELHADDRSVAQMDLLPDWGTAEEHGLPERVSSGIGLAFPTCVVRISADRGVVEVLARSGTREAAVNVPIDADADQLCAAVQLALCRRGAFLRLGAVASVASLFDSAVSSLEFARAAVDTAYGFGEPTGFVRFLHAWLANPLDTLEMERALDDTRVAWARSCSRERRALVASRYAHALCQLLHRSDVGDSSRTLERARAAGDASLELLLGDLSPTARPSQRRIALLAVASHTKGFAELVNEERPGLVQAIQRYQALIRELEESDLPVPAVTRNNLGYAAMTLAGRETRGPDDEHYAMAARQFELVLASAGLMKRADDRPTAERMQLVSELARLDPNATLPSALARAPRAVRLALANRGNLFRLHKEYDSALDCYDAALRLAPDYLEAWAERTWVYADRPLTEDSDPLDDVDHDISQLLQLEIGTRAQRSKAIRHSCRAYLRAGEPERCTQWVEEARALDPMSSDLPVLEAALAAALSVVATDDGT